MDGVDEIVAEFLVESYENLERLGQELIDLESNPAGRDLLASIFRTIHTIKGTSGFLGFGKLERLTHAGESLLSRLRDGVQTMTPEIANALLAMSDAVHAILRTIEHDGTEGSADNQALIDTLTRLQTVAAQASAAPAEPVAAASAKAPAAKRSTAGNGGSGRATREPKAPKQAHPAPANPVSPPAADPATSADAYLDDEADKADKPARAKAKPKAPVRKVGEILVESGLVSAEDVGLAVHEQELGDPRPLGEILAEHGVVNEDDVDQVIAAVKAGADPVATVAALRAARAVPRNPGDATATGTGVGGTGPTVAGKPADKPTATTSAGTSLSSATVRVDVRLLDELMTLVGELVLARNQIIEYNSGQRTPMAAAAQRLDLITTELQARVMTTRMQPIGSAWNRFPRLVRDVSAACGKQVRLELQGAETELDRSLIESVVDPLTHIVRNAVDHGIEQPAERIAAGKSPEGRLLLRAYHEDGQVHIEIADNGTGIDVELVKAKALEKGLVTLEQVAKMSDRDAFDLIFLPGFSTAAHVTNISGRGVGMDVVKTNVERINGLLDIDSAIGRGTTIKIKIPLTLAIIPALVINCDTERYAIPQNSVIELVRLQADQARAGIERLHGVPVYRLHGNLLPLVDLREQLNLAALPDETVCIVVLAARDRMFGLVVDGVHNTEEIVVKPLARQLKSIPAFAGATIMGDGKVALILDVVGIAQRSRVIVDMRNSDQAEIANRHAQREETVPVVLVEGFGGERQAISLRSVSRLETMPRTDLERAFGRMVVQYDGGILPIVELGDLIGGSYDNGLADQIPTVVCHEGDQQFGLIVSRIVDIIDLPQTLIDAANGTSEQQAPLVADGRVTELLEVGRAIRMARPDLFAHDGVDRSLGEDATSTDTQHSGGLSS